MANPEKTSGLFTESADNLNDNGKLELKKAFEQGQKNGNLMWQHVISFDSRWLESNELYDPQTNSVNEEKIREYTRLAVREMQEKEGLSYSSVWSASIHYNKQHHIHVHIAMTEPGETARPIMEYNGKQQPRGKFKQSTLDKTKTVVINRIINQQPQNKIINNIIRNNIISEKQKRMLKNDTVLSNKMQKLYNLLPKDNLRLWNYNSKEIKQLQPFIDSISNDYLNFYHQEDVKELKQHLKEQKQKYSTAYGDTKRHENNYADNKMKDLYARLGNAVLKELRDYEKTVRSEYFRKVKMSKQTCDFQNQIGIHRVLGKLKYALNDETEHFINQNAFDELEREKEYELNR